MIDCLFRSVLRHHLSGCAKGMNISHSCCHSGIAIFGDGYPIPCDPVICERVKEHLEHTVIEHELSCDHRKVDNIVRERKL